MFQTYQSLCQLFVWRKPKYYLIWAFTLKITWFLKNNLKFINSLQNLITITSALLFWRNWNLFHSKMGINCRILETSMETVTPHNTDKTCSLHSFQLTGLQLDFSFPESQHEKSMNNLSLTLGWLHRNNVATDFS